VLVGDLVRERARACGEQEFYRFGKQVVSFASLETITNKVANALLGMGVGEGDRIAILGRTSINWPIIWLANAKIGATNIPINFKLSHSQIEHILKDSQTKLVFYDNSFSDLISELKLRGDNNIKSYISLEKSSKRQ
jgi:acyl-CoA synthetase (AMP-forming)/AMP-acid ligase II